MTPQPVSRQHDSRRTDGSGGARRCCSAIRCRPAPAPPTTTGASDNETVDQDQFSVRIDHRFPANRDQVFGAPDPIPGRVHSGDAAARRQRGDQPARSARRTRRRGRSPRAISGRSRANVLNELRIGDTRRTVGRTAAQLGGTRVGEPRPARHSLERAVSRHAADVSHRRLPAARIAAEHRDRLRHERDADRRLAHVAERPAHAQDGRGPALGAAERRAAAVADRVVHVQQPVHRSARRRQYRHAARQLPARSGAAVLDRPAAGRRSGTARTSRSTSSRTTGGCPIA